MQEFFPSLWLGFSFFLLQKFLILMKYNLLIFSFMGYAFDVVCESFLPTAGSLQLSLLFSCRSLIVLPLIVRCIIQLELIFMYGV